MKAIKLLFSPRYMLSPVTVVTVCGEQRTHTNVRLFGVLVVRIIR